MAIANKIVGNAMQMVVCQLAVGQTVYAEAGRFLWKTTNVSLETHLSKPAASQGSGSGGGGGERGEGGGRGGGGSPAPALPFFPPGWGWRPGALRGPPPGGAGSNG